MQCTACTVHSMQACAWQGPRDTSAKGAILKGSIMLQDKRLSRATHLYAVLVARQVVLVHLAEAAVQVSVDQVHGSQPGDVVLGNEEVVDQAVVCAWRAGTL